MNNLMLILHITVATLCFGVGLNTTVDPTIELINFAAAGLNAGLAVDRAIIMLKEG